VPRPAEKKAGHEAFPGYMDRLHELLLPVQQEVIVPY
jgi:hypothetical protein